MSRPSAEPSGPPEKTLVFCPIGLGNFLMATPALKFLSEGVGKGNLGLLALKGGIRDMARGSGLFGEVFYWDPDKEGKHRGLKVLAAIRRAGYARSLALFPTSHWKFSLFAALCGASSRTGFAYPNQKGPERLQSLSVPLDLDAHDTDQNIRLVEAFLGRPFAGSRLPWFPLPTKPFDPPEKAYYVCHPGSSAERGMDEKRLPPATYAALLRRIRAETGLRALLIGGPEEAPLRKTILEGAPEAAFEAPAGSLEGVAGQIAGSRFFLGNDSGLMHMAASLRIPCAAFFGPTDERRTGPYPWWDAAGEGPRHVVLRKQGLGCSPCWTLRTLGRNPPCGHGDTRCLSAFSVDEIWPRLAPFLSGTLGPALR